MNVVEFPCPANERWNLEREFDDLRFDIQSARMISDRLRFRNAEDTLASNIDREIVDVAMIHLGSLIAFLSEIRDRMDGKDIPQSSIPAHILQSWKNV
jgi:hypothetical protein